MASFGRGITLAPQGSTSNSSPFGPCVPGLLIRMSHRIRIAEWPFSFSADNLRDKRKPSERFTSGLPRLHENYFRLHDPGRANSLTGMLIPLPPGRSLIFVGTAYIRFLQGAVTVLGTPLQPSLDLHRTFSPRSSPLASIEADMSSTRDQPNNIFCSEGQKLPQQILNATNASYSILVIRPLVTGVEGLGTVCKTFEGVFRLGPRHTGSGR